MRDRDPYAAYDPFRLRVFVPAIMSAGLVFSLATLARDVLAGRDHRGAERRAALAAAAVVNNVLRVEPDPDEVGLRPRRFYLLVAIGTGAAAAYLAPGALLNYAHDGGYVSDIAWLLGTSLLVAALAITAASVAAATWWRWPSPPPWARRAIALTPLGAAPGSPAAVGGEGAAPSLGASVFAAAGALAALAVGVGSARATFETVDDLVVEQVDGWQVPAVVEGLAALGDTEIAILLALLVGASTLRCRPFAASWALVVTGAFGFDILLKSIIERPRPGAGPTGLDDSFPSGHVVQATLLAMAVPLAVRVVTGRRWPGVAAGLLLGGVAAVTALERVQGGTHWPSDVAGGALLGVTAGCVLRWAVGHRRWHVHCRDCPWQAPVAPVRAPRPFIRISSGHARALRWTAAAWLGVVVAGLLFVAANGGLPRNPEGEGTLTTVEEPAQLGFIALAAIGGLLAVRWGGVGATAIAVSALGLGLLASVEHPLWVVVALTLAVGLPSVLLWLAWQHVRRPGAIITLAVVVAGLLTGEAAAVLRIYDHFLGPAHPESSTPALDVDLVEWAWAGDLRTDGVTVVARLDDGAGTGEVDLLVEPEGDGDGAGAPRVAATARPDSDGIVRLRAAGLPPATAHRWWLAVDGDADEGRGRGRFTTAPDGPASFTLAAGSCARTGSDGAVYDAIRAQDPLLYLATGDLHYANLEATEPGPFLHAFGRVLTSPAQAALFRDVPVDYVWDDHDYGPNDADSTSPGRAAARAAYRQAAPHPPLPSDGAIFHASTIGRVRIVVTDTRSERTDTSMLGEEQLAWLLDELAAADRWGLVVWVNPDPWIAPDDPTRDDWGGFAEERRTIADAITAAGVDNLVMVSGDAHMLAIDDGTNSDYSAAPGGGFPVLHAAALDRPGNVKGGPYSEGAIGGAGQFGVLRITDDGGPVTVELEGRDWNGEVLLQHRFVAG